VIIALSILGALVVVLACLYAAGYRADLKFTWMPKSKMPPGWKDARQGAGQHLYGDKDSAVQVVRGCAWCDKIEAHEPTCPLYVASKP
jgi:hypothetical protein